MTLAPSPPNRDSAVPVLRIEDLHKSYGDIQAVKGISFEIAPGENYGLLGPNGAGKTTTILMIAGVLAADGGRVTVCGKELTTTTTAVKSHIGWVPQEVALYDPAERPREPGILRPHAGTLRKAPCPTGG